MSVARERPPVERIVRPFQDFADKQSSGGIVLIAATVIALAWANSPWAESYAALWHTKLTVGVRDPVLFGIWTPFWKASPPNSRVST
jgi:NhaA family Na+:H+ antiporter